MEQQVETVKKVHEVEHEVTLEELKEMFFGAG